MTGRLNEAGQNPKLLADLLLGFTMDETPFASSALILPTKSGLLGGTSTSATRHSSGGGNGGAIAAQEWCFVKKGETAAGQGTK